MKQAMPSIDKRPDFGELRKDFPILESQVNGKPLVYLDNAASSQMPRQVADRIDRYHRMEHANVHRGIHTLSQRATDEFERTRHLIREFINAESEDEVVYTTGTTDSINLVAATFGRRFRTGDEILLSEMEHHANIVPWQLVAEQTGAVIRVIPVTEKGEIDMEAYRNLLGPKTKMVSVVHVSNALGTINPVSEIVRLAHENGTPVLLDGAQAVPHQKVDVQELGCDFYAFSAHKMYGPTGFGILYGKKEHLDEMPPYRGGGEMIDRVTFEKTTWNVPPFRFEAGTPPIAAAIGLGAAVEYINSIGMEHLEQREKELMEYALWKIRQVEGIRLVGEAVERSAVISFVMDGIHAQDVGTLLDKQGVAVRTGHHCAQPILERFGLTATARASFAFYNTEEEIDRLIDGLNYVKEFFT